AAVCLVVWLLGASEAGSYCDFWVLSVHVPVQGSVAWAFAWPRAPMTNADANTRETVTLRMSHLLRCRLFRSGRIASGVYAQNAPRWAGFGTREPGVLASGPGFRRPRSSLFRDLTDFFRAQLRDSGDQPGRNGLGQRKADRPLTELVRFEVVFEGRND